LLELKHYSIFVLVLIPVLNLFYNIVLVLILVPTIRTINSVPVLVPVLELELKYKLMVLKLFLVPVLRTGTTPKPV